MDVKTIICPNCGATTSNFHNCEYCGSFLVQKASKGEDVSEYIKSTYKYDSSGLISVFKKMVDLCQKYPDEAQHISLEFYTDRDVFLNVFWSDKDCGIYIKIIYEALEDNGVASRFLNSKVIDAFFFGFIETEEGIFKFYRADFGYDYNGAARVVAQLLDDVYSYRFDKNTVTIRISIGEMDLHYALYNLNGVFLEGLGDGENEFKDVKQAFIDNNDPEKRLEWEAANSLPEENYVDGEEQNNGGGVFVSIVLILAIIFFVLVAFVL